MNGYPWTMNYPWSVNYPDEPWTTQNYKPMKSDLDKLAEALRLNRIPNISRTQGFLQFPHRTPTPRRPPPPQKKKKKSH